MKKYEACILEIRLAVGINIKEILIIGDSDLPIHHVRGEWTTKNVKILPYKHCVKELCKNFTKVEFKYVPKIQNEFVDTLVTFSSMIQHPDKNYIDPIEIKVRDHHVYCFHMDEEPDGKPWYYDIKREVLYRRTPVMGLLRCVDSTEATRLLEEVHAGTCMPHINGFTLAKKILISRYFWMTMESDSICYVQKYHRCQIYGDFIRVPPNELNVMGSPWPFAAWGMDVIGPIGPAALNRHRFILVAID
ncbi:uncharacterized protein [Nicotiana tomentosiformis]|uniref:uncharacterized protein n=1 Tax=Nicotiana tomentosiformis TaxID=4098 RepID=UPI00388CA8F3